MAERRTRRTEHDADAHEVVSLRDGERDRGEIERERERGAGGGGEGEGRERRTQANERTKEGTRSN